MSFFLARNGPPAMSDLNVRSWVNSGRDFLAASFSGFDPEPTKGDK